MKKQNLCSAAAELKKTMKISNSKKQLAQIIHENGGWHDEAQFSAQDKDGEVFHYASKPTIGAGREVWNHKGCIGEGEFTAEKLPNWHQTILSRDEYSHLYPAQDAEVSVYGDSTLIIPGDPMTAMRRMQDSLVFDTTPTIEQLSADYRNAKDYAERKQQEADAAKADAEAKLAELIAAGKAHGLVLSVADPEPELVITDWRDLLPGDEVEYVEGSQAWSIGLVGVVQRTDDDNGGNMNVRLLFRERGTGWPKKWRFIRRP